MTPEEINELKELIKMFKNSDIFRGIMLAVFMIMLVAWIMIDIYKIKKVKEIWKNYYITLNDSQKEAVRKYREINK